MNHWHRRGLGSGDGYRIRPAARLATDPPVWGPRAAQGSSGLAQATVSSALELQQTAGNKAVAVAIAGLHRVVQRHSSFEHALLGNTKPADVKEAHFGAKDDGEKLGATSWTRN